MRKKIEDISGIYVLIGVKYGYIIHVQNITILGSNDFVWEENDG